jgi:hypothetical protein
MDSREQVFEEMVLAVNIADCVDHDAIGDARLVRARARAAPSKQVPPHANHDA